MKDLSDEDRAQLAYRWSFWARDNQLPPAGDWRFWLVMAGRGFGKTRTGAEWIRGLVESGELEQGRIALVGRTAADVRDVMVEGDGGLLSVCPPWNRPDYTPSNRRVTWASGAYATMFSAEEPDMLRGPQHEAVWVDELASWRYQQDTWDMLLLGLRRGKQARGIITTTPRPTPLIKSLVKDQTGTVAITRGSTYDNLANLAPAFARDIISRYEGTRLGRQELMAEVLDDNPGALWSLSQIEALRVKEVPVRLVRVVVAIDPAITNTEESDETGIVVAGSGEDGHIYVLADLTCRKSPDGWARVAVMAYHQWEANQIVYEANQGGDMVALTLHTADPNVPVFGVHAKRGKQLRAEPVSMVYEQGKAHHVGCFAALEDQMTSWEPGMASWETSNTNSEGKRSRTQRSPDRMDALVYACLDLINRNMTSGDAQVQPHINVRDVPRQPFGGQPLYDGSDGDDEDAPSQRIGGGRPRFGYTVR